MTAVCFRAGTISAVITLGHQILTLSWYVGEFKFCHCYQKSLLQICLKPPSEMFVLMSCHTARVKNLTIWYILLQFLENIYNIYAWTGKGRIVGLCTIGINTAIFLQHSDCVFLFSILWKISIAFRVDVHEIISTCTKRGQLYRVLINCYFHCGVEGRV